MSDITHSDTLGGTPQNALGRIVASVLGSILTLVCIAWALSVPIGHKRGRPAKICVVGSGLFGMISGSAVSNVAAIGPLTIPMMILRHFSAQP